MRVVARAVGTDSRTTTGYLQHQPQFPVEPDFLGLTPEQARDLATERGLALRVRDAGRGYAMTADLRPNRVTAELEGGVIVYAQRY